MPMKRFAKRIGLPVVISICLVALIGILVIILTREKYSKLICSFVFHSYPPDINDLDSRPQSIVVLDFNHDRHPDLITLHSNTHTLAIYFGRADGRFDEPLRHFIAPNAYPRSLAVAHLNHDDHLDIVVANYAIHSISVLFGTGNGSVMNPMSYSTSTSRPRQVTVGDMSGDDLMDIVVLGEGTNEVFVFVNVGNGSFVYWKSYWTGWDSLPCFVSVADLDSDHHSDLIVVNNGTNEILIFYDHQNITLITGRDSHPTHIVVADVNDDQHLDLLVAKFGKHEIGFYLGTGNGSFEQGTSVSTGSYSPSAVGIHDFNNDGKQDLLIIYESDSAFEIQLGSGSGDFSSEKIYLLNNSLNPTSFAVATINNDSRSDLILVYTNADSFEVFLGENRPSFNTRIVEITVPINLDLVFVQAIDMNFNNHSDIVFIDENMTLNVLFGFGNGSFGKPHRFPLESYNLSSSFIIEDFNEDHQMDLVNYNQISKDIYVYLQDTNGSFQPPLVFSTDSIFLSVPILQTTDVNNDDHRDLILIDVDIALIVVLLGFGNGTFRYPGIQSNVSQSLLLNVVPGDLNKDGYVDIVVSVYDRGIVVLFGDGNGRFINETFFPSIIGSTLVSIAIDDLNNDQNLDVLGVYLITSHIGLWFGDGRGNFSVQQVFFLATNSAPAIVLIKDVNNDRRQDLLVFFWEKQHFSILLGIGNGSFGSEIIYPLSSPVNGLSSADFDEDGRLDLVVAIKNSTDTLSVLLNYDGGTQISSKIYGTGTASRPVAIATADVNNDHRSDVFIVELGTETINLRLTLENQSFISQTIYKTGEGSSPRAIVLADFNKDQRIDLIVATTGKDSVVLLTQQTNGSFSERATYLTGEQSRPTAMTVADLNDDGWLDLAVGGTGNNNISIFFGFRYLTFVYQIVCLTDAASWPEKLVVADFNNDQLADIIVASTNRPSISLFLGQLSGECSSQLKFAIEENSQVNNFAFGDLDNNHRLDLAMSMTGTPSILIFFNFNNITLAWEQQLSLHFEDAINTLFVFIVDFNEDGNLDLMVTFPNLNQIRMLVGFGNGSFASASIFTSDEPLRPDYLIISDYNRDEHLDLIIIDLFRNEIGTSAGDGRGNFSPVVRQQINSKPVTSLVITADLNEDSCNDLILTKLFSQRIEIFFGTVNGSFVNQTIYVNPLFAQISAADVSDINQDGHVDVVFTINSVDTSIYVLYGSGDGTFATDWGEPLGFLATPWAIAIYDFNGDSYLDFVVTISNINSIVVLFGYCCVPFNRPVVLSGQVGGLTTSLISADIDNDQHIDLIVSYARTNSIGIFYNRGDGSFENYTSFLTSTKNSPSSIAVGDLNNDQQLDLVVALYADEQIDIYLGTHNRTFRLHRSYWTGQGTRPRSLVIVDLNNDTYLDIAVTNDGTDTVGLLFGRENASFDEIYHFNTGFDSQPFAITHGSLFSKAVDLVLTMFQSNSIGTISRECRIE